MSAILKFTIEKNYDDENLQVNERNVERMLKLAIDLQAQ
jgi:hypothetical protein